MEIEVLLNELLVQLFKDITDIEEKTIITEEYGDITTNDMHIIEAIGPAGKKSMSEVAKLLSITTGTLTITAGNLVRKGYILRERGKKDKRNVFVRLSEKGVRAYRQHQQFHDEMIKAIIAELSDEEKVLLEKALSKLNKYFKNLKF